MDVPLTLIPQVMFGSLDKFTLLAVPFFVFLAHPACPILGLPRFFCLTISELVILYYKKAPRGIGCSAGWIFCRTEIIYRSAFGSTRTPSIEPFELWSEK